MPLSPVGTGTIVTRDARKCTMGVDKFPTSLSLLSPFIQYPTWPTPAGSQSLTAWLRHSIGVVGSGLRAG